MCAVHMGPKSEEAHGELAALYLDWMLERILEATPSFGQQLRQSFETAA